MIIVQLQGGTGNQMFQYALGYKLAKKNNVELKLDISRYANAKPIISYDTNNTSQNEFSTLTSIKKTRFVEYLRKVKRWLNSPYSTKYYGTEVIRTYRLFNFSTQYKPLNLYDLIQIKLKRKLILVEFPEKDAYIFDKKILNTEDNSYIVGYWQSNKYFEDIQAQLREEFTVITPPSIENQKTLELIKNSNSICLHVRRGDYLKPAHIKSHGVISNEYYKNAIDYYLSKIENPHFFVFSDEPAWAKENIKINAPVHISYNSLDKEYEDIRLMYSCKHFIIANSSLSWWGAWLSNNPNKIIIAPKKWVADQSINSEDCVPSNWLRM